VAYDRTRKLIHGLGKKTQFCVSFIALWSQKGSFGTTKSCKLSNRSLSTSTHIEILATMVWSCAQNVPGSIGDWRGKSYSLQPRERGPDVTRGPGGPITSPTLLGPVLCGTSRTVRYWFWPWGISSPPGTAAPATLPSGRMGVKINKLFKSVVTLTLIF